MREPDVAVLADTCVVEQTAAAAAADVEAGGFVAQMYSWDIEVAVVVIWLAWQLLLEGCKWVDLVDRRNLVVAPLLDDGGAGQEAY